jgi:hypothetical protein
MRKYFLYAEGEQAYLVKYIRYGGKTSIRILASVRITRRDYSTSLKRKLIAKVLNNTRGKKCKKEKESVIKEKIEKGDLYNILY